MPLLKGGFVLVDYVTGAVQRLIPLQYNPETLTRTLQVQGVGPESGPHVDQMRLKGPPIETFKFDAELDATDMLDSGDPLATASGIQPQLAALETVIYPTSTQLQQANANEALHGNLPRTWWLLFRPAIREVVMPARSRRYTSTARTLRKNHRCRGFWRGSTRQARASVNTSRDHVGRLQNTPRFCSRRSFHLR